MVSLLENRKEEIRLKSQARREKRLQRFENSRNQTINNSACHNCFWQNKPFGQSPCKSCSRFDSSRILDKFKTRK